MTALRRLLSARPLLALCLIAVAMLARVVVPSGYMLDTAGGSITVTLCSGTGPVTMTMPLPPSGAPHPAHDGDHHKAEAPCPFATVAAPALGGADPILLAAALAWIVAVAARTMAAPRIALRLHLRPPLRGPPVTG